MSKKYWSSFSIWKLNVSLSAFLLSQWTFTHAVAGSMLLEKNCGSLVSRFNSDEILRANCRIPLMAIAPMLAIWIVARKWMPHFCLQHRFYHQEGKAEYTIWHCIVPSQPVYQKIHCRELLVLQDYFGVSKYHVGYGRWQWRRDRKQIRIKWKVTELYQNWFGILSKLWWGTSFIAGMSSKPNCCEVSCSHSTARLCAVSSSFCAIVSSISGDDLGMKVRCMRWSLDAMKSWWDEDLMGKRTDYPSWFAAYHLKLRGKYQAV